MKEIRETKFVEQTTIKFVAFDGTEFDKDYDCRAYEDRCNREDLKIKIKPVVSKLDMPFFDFMGYDVYKAKARNTEDIVSLYSYFEDDWYSFADYEEFFEIDKTVYVLVNEDGYVYFYKRGNLEDEIKNYGKKKTEKKTDK